MSKLRLLSVLTLNNSIQIDLHRFGFAYEKMTEGPDHQQAIGGPKVIYLQVERIWYQVLALYLHSCMQSLR